MNEDYSSTNVEITDVLKVASLFISCVCLLGFSGSYALVLWYPVTYFFVKTGQTLSLWVTNKVNTSKLYQRKEENQSFKNLKVLSKMKRNFLKEMFHLKR